MSLFLSFAQKESEWPKSFEMAVYNIKKQVTTLRLLIVVLLPLYPQGLAWLTIKYEIAVIVCSLNFRYIGPNSDSHLK